MLAEFIDISRDEFTLSESGVSKKTGGKYVLNERGHELVNQMIAFPEVTSADYEQLVDRKFFGKQARRRHKIGYVFAGAIGGYCVAIVAIFLFAIASRALNGYGPQIFNEWFFWATVLFLAPIAGGIGGYWIGLNRNFKRPAPEWSK